MTAAADAVFVHATALAVGETGLLLRGASGSGKSALALALISHTQAHGAFARLVGDDRVGLEIRNGRLLARPHPSIAGLIEARGLGLAAVAFEPVCVLHAIVDICAAGERPPRYPDVDERRAVIQGIALPRLFVESGDAASVARIILFLQGIKTF